jgi:hypothetical protein
VQVALTGDPQQSLPSRHAPKLGTQLQNPPLHTPVQHCEPSLHVAPITRQQRPLLQLPSQQPASTHAAPVGKQQRFRLQLSPLQQSPAVLQVLPIRLQQRSLGSHSNETQQGALEQSSPRPTQQVPTSQRESQHATVPVQVSPFAAQATQRPLDASHFDPAQHSASLSQNRPTPSQHVPAAEDPEQHCVAELLASPTSKHASSRHVPPKHTRSSQQSGSAVHA